MPKRHDQNYKKNYVMLVYCTCSSASTVGVHGTHFLILSIQYVRYRMNTLLSEMSAKTIQLVGLACVK